MRGAPHNPSGLGLKIDQVDIGRAGFVRCQPNGCVAEVVMDDNLLKQLRAGQTATFIIFQTPEEGIGFPISLKGFGEGSLGQVVARQIAALGSWCDRRACQRGRSRRARSSSSPCR